MTISRRYRGSDTDPGWINRKFRDLEAQIRLLRSAKTVEFSPVPALIEASKRARSWPQIDQHTITALGTQTMVLSHVPERTADHFSLHLYWNGAWMDPAEYAVDGRMVTILDPGHRFHITDVLTAQYRYSLDAPSAADSDVVTASEPVGGWAYLVVDPADTTDWSTSDGSAFTYAPFPISDSLSAHPASGWTNPASAVWPVDHDIWVRRRVASAPGVARTLTIRVDDFLGGVWWNGVLIYGPESSSTPYGERIVNVTGADVTGDDTLVIFCCDGLVPGPGDRDYIDVILT